MKGKEKWCVVLAALIVLAGTLWTVLDVRKVLVNRAALQMVAPYYGVGVCHSVPSARPHEAMSWAYATTPEVWWAELEPQKGVFDFSLIDKRIEEWSEAETSVWFSIQAMGVGIDGRRKAPMWLFDEGAVWISGTCTNDGMIPPWDEVYLERLQLLLAAVNAHIAGWDEGYQDAVAGVIAMSGGMYGEMQVSSCGVKAAMKAHYGLADAQFNARYGDAVALLADYYFTAFPNTNVMWQVGYCTTAVDAALEQDVVDYLVMLYGDRLFVKWAGLSPACGLDWQKRANEHYQEMFSRLSDVGVRVGYEPAKIDNYQTPIGSGVWDAAKFEEVFAVAKNSVASFMCFQPVMLPGLFGTPGWLAFDAALEANAPAAQTTATPTATLPAVVGHKGGVTWPGSPVGLADGLVDLGVNAVHHWNYSEARLTLMEEKGIEYLPHIWGCGVTDNSWDVIDLEAIAAFAAKHPGLRWLMFNEPDRPDQANCSPEMAADVFHDVYYTLKAADPTCKVSCCGTSRYQGHWKWMGAFMRAYSEKYLGANGGIPPFDELHYHFYPEDHASRFDDLAVQQAILNTVALNERWCCGWDIEMSKLPWIITEWGILSEEDDGPDEIMWVGEFLRRMWQFLETRCPQVQFHFWYSTYVEDMSGNLFVSRTNDELTSVGRMWRDMARATPLPTASPTASPLPTNTLTPQATTTSTLTNTPAPTATITPSPTRTPMPTATVTPSPTRTSVPTATITPTATVTPSLTRTATATATLMPTAAPTHVVIHWICEFDMTTWRLICKPAP